MMITVPLLAQPEVVDDDGTLDDDDAVVSYLHPCNGGAACLPVRVLRGPDTFANGRVVTGDHAVIRLGQPDAEVVEVLKPTGTAVMIHPWGGPHRYVPADTPLLTFANVDVGDHIRIRLDHNNVTSYSPGHRGAVEGEATWRVHSIIAGPIPRMLLVDAESGMELPLELPIWAAARRLAPAELNARTTLANGGIKRGDVVVHSYDGKPLHCWSMGLLHGTGCHELRPITGIPSNILVSVDLHLDKVPPSYVLRCVACTCLWHVWLDGKTPGCMSLLPGEKACVFCEEAPATDSKVFVVLFVDDKGAVRVDDVPVVAEELGDHDGDSTPEAVEALRRQRAARRKTRTCGKCGGTINVEGPCPVCEDKPFGTTEWTGDGKGGVVEAEPMTLAPGVEPVVIPVTVPVDESDGARLADASMADVTDNDVWTSPPVELTGPSDGAPVTVEDLRATVNEQLRDAGFDVIEGGADEE